MLQTAPCYSAQAADAWASGAPGGAPGTADGPSSVFGAFDLDEGGPPLRSAEGGPSPSTQLKEAMQQVLCNSELHPTTRHALLNALLLLRSKKMVKTFPC